MPRHRDGESEVPTQQSSSSGTLVMRDERQRGAKPATGGISEPGVSFARADATFTLVPATMRGAQDAPALAREWTGRASVGR